MPFIDRNSESGSRLRRNMQRLASGTASTIITLNPSGNNAIIDTSSGYGVFTDDTSISTISGDISVLLSPGGGLTDASTGLRTILASTGSILTVNSTGSDISLPVGSTGQVLTVLDSTGDLGWTTVSSGGGGGGSTYIVLAGNSGISTSTSTSGTTVSTYVFNTSTGVGEYLPLSGGDMTGPITLGYAAAPQTFFNESLYMPPDSGYTGSGEWGLSFSTTVPGFVVGGAFFKQSSNTGTHVLSLWKYGTATLLASTTFVGETSSGWQQQLFGSPVAVSSNVLYMIGYGSSTGHNSQSSAASGTVGYITVPTDPSGFNGTIGNMPTNGAPNDYGVDVLFTPGSTNGNVLYTNGAGQIDLLQLGSVGQVLTVSTSSTIGWSTISGGGGGGVTSVGLSLPSTVFSTSGSPVTSTGTLTATFLTETSTLVFAGPSSGAAAAPTFRKLVNGDIPAALSSVYLPLAGGTMAGTLNLNQNLLTFDSLSNIIGDGSGNIIISGNTFELSVNSFIQPNVTVAGGTSLISTGSAAGTAASGASSAFLGAVPGQDAAGTISISTGTVTSTGVVARISTSGNYPNGTSVVISPADSTAAAVAATIFVASVSFSGLTWTVNSFTTPLASSTVYRWNYIVTGY
jgi:hypothetical protein